MSANELSPEKAFAQFSNICIDNCKNIIGIFTLPVPVPVSRIAYKICDLARFGEQEHGYTIYFGNTRPSDPLRTTEIPKGFTVCVLDDVPRETLEKNSIAILQFPPHKKEGVISDSPSWMAVMEVKLVDSEFDKKVIVDVWCSNCKSREEARKMPEHFGDESLRCMSCECKVDG